MSALGQKPTLERRSHFARFVPSGRRRRSPTPSSLSRRMKLHSSPAMFSTSMAAKGLRIRSHAAKDHRGVSEALSRRGSFTSSVIFDCLLLSELRNPMAVDSACPSSNCHCFRCRRSLIEINSYGQLLWGCVNCKLWWEGRGPVRPHLSREQLLALNLDQAPAGTPDAITG